MNEFLHRELLLTVAAGLLFCAMANAQYDSGGFELPDYAGTWDGTVLTGQDWFYKPSGTGGSVDYYCYTYGNNELGVVAHPTGGGEQFVAGVGPGVPYARAERGMSWGSGVWTVTYDVAALYLGSGTPQNNIGSFSIQPLASASEIHLFSWTDAANRVWRAGYMVYTAAGGLHGVPGLSPGPEWDNLVLNHWYRFETVIDFDLNKVTEGSITDLHTGSSASFIAPENDWYLNGGAAGGDPPTGFRLFAGGVAPDNCVALDNLTISLGPTNQPPVITCNGPVALWSPNHEFVDASAAFTVVDPDVDPVDVSIRVYADETEIPDTGDGTGRHAPDYKTQLASGAQGHFLRSERRGAEDGRFYIGVITADDGNGGVTTQVCVLAVCPHDQNNPASLVDVLDQAEAAALDVQDAVDAGGPLPPPGLYEHGLSDPLGPHQ